MTQRFILMAFMILLASMALGQVGINTDGSQPDPSAMLDIKSNVKGFLPPRVALTAINVAAPIVSPAIGLLVYNTAIAGNPPNNVVAGYYYWDGTKWASLVGTPGTAADTSLLLHKKDSIRGYVTPYDISGLAGKDSLFWVKVPGSTNNIYSKNSGNVGIGIMAPDETLSVAGTLDFGNILVQSGKKLRIFRQSVNTDIARGICLSAAFSAASAGDNIIIGSGNYSISVTLTVKAFQTITLQGSKITSTNNAISIFTATNISNWKIKGDGLLTGAGPASGGTYTNERGIAILGNVGVCSNWEISGLSFTNFKGCAIYSNASSGSYPYDKGGSISNNDIYGNNFGIYLDSPTPSNAAHYNTIYDNHVYSNNNYGIYIMGGNCMVLNNTITSNYNGIYLGTGYNNAHGIISNNEINHNIQYGINFDGITNGETVTNNHILVNGVNLYLNACQGVNVLGGMVYAGTSDIRMNGTIPGLNFIRNVYSSTLPLTIAASSLQRAKLIVDGCTNYTSQNPEWNNAEWLDSLLFVKYLPWGTGSERMIVWDTATKQFMKRPIPDFTATSPLVINSGIIKSRRASSSDSGYIDPVHYTNWNTAYGWGNHAGLYRPVSYVPSWGEITGIPTFASVATSGSYPDLINKPAIDGSETKVTAGTNVTVTGTGTTGSPYIINSTGITSHYIGESYAGGKVFYVSEGGLHGLIAATTDQSTAVHWYNGSSILTNAVRDKIYAGQQNTERIIINQGAGSYAAQFCANYQGGDYGDWYLPSKYELNLLYLQQAVIGGFSTGNYWSSSEFDANDVWSQDFASGTQQNINKATTYNVRAVRAF